MEYANLLAVAWLIIKLYFQINFKIEVSSSDFKIYNYSLESYKGENSWHNSTNTCSIKERIKKLNFKKIKIYLSLFDVIIWFSLFTQSIYIYWYIE
jgi:hypothetical protein